MEALMNTGNKWQAMAIRAARGVRAAVDVDSTPKRTERYDDSSMYAVEIGGYTIHGTGKLFNKIQDEIAKELKARRERFELSLRIS